MYILKSAEKRFPITNRIWSTKENLDLTWACGNSSHTRAQFNRWLIFIIRATEVYLS